MAAALAAVLVLKGAALATAGLSFAVDDPGDRIDVNVGDGTCRTSLGTCSLRAAIQEANALPGADTILVPSGTYALAIPPQGTNGITTGDLDITDSVTIDGAGAGSTILDGGTPPAGAPPEVRGLDRLFEVQAGGGTVTFSDLTISDGYAAEYGGAILNSSSATVTITDSIVRGSTAGKTGGAIDNHVGGTVNLLSSTLTANYAVEGGSALNNNLNGLVELTGSTVTANGADAVGLDETLRGAGAIANNAEHDEVGTIVVVDSQVSDNHAGGGRSGGGIWNKGAGTIIVERTTFSKNGADGDGGAIYNGTGEVTVTDSTFSENAADDGGAIASIGGMVDVLASSFSKNRAEDWGGGVLNGNQGAVTIRSSSFSENSALNGGGFANEGTGLVTVESSTFTKNTAVDTALLSTGEGGGMHSNSGGEVVVFGGSFTENRAHAGGGLSNEGGGRVTITGTLFTTNFAEAQGGGILIEGGDVRMVDIDVVGNVSDSPEEGGGGISYAGDKSVSGEESAAIEGSRIRDNKSKSEGGGIDSRGDGPLLITTTAITGNTAAIGGAIHHVGDASIAVTRSTLSGNFAENGGGLFVDGDGEATLENTTVSGNRAAQFGGGLLVSSRMTVRNSTVVANNAASGGGIDNGGGPLIADGQVFLANTIVANNPTGSNCAGVITSRGGNLENGNSCQLSGPGDQPGTDARIGSLADNGGPTQTHALLAASAAQDSAVCTDLDPCPPVDQRGVERPKFAGFDVGAFESELSPGGGSTPLCPGRTERPVLSDFDSWVSQSSANANFGSDGILRVQSQSGGNERALVHFALPAPPPGCELVGATLRLYASAATNGRTLQAFRLASGWSELGVTWGNQPLTDGPPAATGSGLGFREWDVLPQTLGMYASGDHGFLIRDAVENGNGPQSFHSGERVGDRPPELVLVFDDPDAPPTGDCPKTPQLLYADRDSWVSQGSPTNNSGSDSTLKVKSQGGSNSRALVGFPLPPLPPGCTTVASAVLRLEAGSAKEGHSLQALQVASGWSEPAVTWNNQPTATGPAATTPSGHGPLEWDVTDQTLGLYVSGNHGFQVRDAVENGVGDEQAFNSREKGESPPELLFAFDDSTPETTIDSGPVSPTDESGATFDLSSDHADAAFECSLDGHPFQACTSTHTIESLVEGDHRLEVRATRRVRAVDPTPATYDWTVAIPPETTLAGPDSPSADPNATLSFSSDDPDATFECSRNGDPYAACTSPVELADLADGEQEFRVQAVDPLRNVDPTPAGHAWTVAVPPETTITQQPADPSNSRSAFFAFSGHDNGTDASELTFECSFAGGAFTGCSSPVEHVGLADGSHTFAVRATDAAGNTDPTAAAYTWIVDTTPPQSSIDSAPEPLTRSASASFTFSADEAGSTFECSIDDEPYAGCASPAEYGLLTDGAHTFRVRALDRVGNVEAEPATYEWTIDRSPPQTTIDSGPDALTNTTGATFAFTANEAGSGFECSLDGAPYTSCAPPVEHADLTEGDHTFSVRATDPAGNTDPSPATHSWTIDTTAPQTAIDSAPETLTNTTSASFAFTANEASSGFECSLDGAPFSTCSSPVEHAGLTEGEHTFAVRATDPAGNTDASPATHAWTIDTTAPQTTIGSGPDALTNSTDASFSFSTNEADSGFECSLDDTPFTTCTSPVGHAGLPAGTHEFRVRATDPAGNLDPTPASHVWTIDRTAPETTIDSAPAALTRSTSATFAFSADEAGSSFRCSLDDAPYAECSSPVRYDALGDGDHTFAVRATDPAGNSEPSAAGHSWTIDTTPPDTAITSAPPATTQSTSASFAFTAGQAGSSFECSLDNAPYTACASPADYADLGEGDHTFAVRATDPAGNTDASPAAHAWTIDSSPPETTIDSAPDALTHSTSASFAFAADEGDSSFDCSLDGAPYADCASPVEYAALGEGDHTFAVRATDPAGNTDASPAAHAWTIDTSPPETTIDSAPAALTQSSSASFSFSANEAGPSFQCSLDGAPYAACTSPAEYAGLGDGDHTFAVRAIDPAGNTDPTPASHGWTIDTTPPDTTITTAPPATTQTTSATFTFTASQADSSFECSLDNAPFTACSPPHQYTGLAPGAHQFRARATDPAGNVDPTPAAHAWTIEEPSETVPPETTIISAPAAITSSTNAAFAFSASESGSTFACSLDGGPFAGCASPAEYAALGPGDHSFAVRAADPAGNVDPTPATYSWTIDTGAPQTSIDGGPQAVTSAPSATFGFSTDEAGSSFECSLDGAPFTACSSPRQYTGLAPGAHQFRVRATDTAGNVDPTPAAYSWTIDTSAPQTSIDAGPAALTTSTSAGFTFSANEAGSTFECSLDNAPFTACSSPRQYSGLAQGTHTFAVRATDPAGNTDPTPAGHSWTIDTTPPDTTITTAPPATTQTASATFTFTASQAGSSFECSLDNAPFTTCSPPHQYTGLAPGAHQFRARATDPAGNVDPTPATHPWTIQPPPVDTTPPNTTITSAPAATTSSTSAGFTFSANEAGSTFECSLDNAPFTACSSPRQYSGLAQGTHTFAVRAIDPAGNTDPTPASHGWTIDTSAPQTSIDAGPAALTTSTSAGFTFSANEAGSSFECSLDNAPFTACSPPHQYTGLAPGAHQFRVRATDPAGNVDPTPAAHAWTIEASTGCTGSTVTVGANADTWVLESSPTSTYGNDSIVKLDTKAGANARVLVRFALPAIPAGCQVVDAQLRLYASSHKTGRTLQALRLGAAWTEQSVSWSNQPAPTGAAATAPSAGGYVQWSVGSQVQNMYGANHGFLVRDSTEGGNGIEQGFHSREKGTDNPPQLVIMFG